LYGLAGGVDANARIRILVNHLKSSVYIVFTTFFDNFTTLLLFHNLHSEYLSEVETFLFYFIGMTNGALWADG
jgi:hypothetical protein